MLNRSASLPLRWMGRLPMSFTYNALSLSLLHSHESLSLSHLSHTYHFLSSAACRSTIPVSREEVAWKMNHFSWSSQIHLWSPSQIFTTCYITCDCSINSFLCKKTVPCIVQNVIAQSCICICPFLDLWWQLDFLKNQLNVKHKQRD